MLNVFLAIAVDNLADAESLTAVEKEDGPDTELDNLTEKSENGLGGRDNEDEEDLNGADEIEGLDDDDENFYKNDEPRRVYDVRSNAMEDSTVDKTSKKFGTFGFIFSFGLSHKIGFFF